MELPYNKVIRLEGRHECESTRVAPLRRGVGLIIDKSLQSQPPWSIQQEVALARIIAADSCIQSKPVFALESALLLHDIPQWTRNPDVFVRTPSRYVSSRLHTVTFGETVVEARKIRQCKVSIPGAGNTAVKGMLTDSLDVTGALMAMRRTPMEAVVAVSGILRHMSSFDRFDQVGSRARENSARALLLEQVARAGARPGVDKARHIITLSTGACESVGEAALLAILLTLFPEELISQFEVYVHGKTYYTDFALLRWKIIVEFDGVAKMGTNTQEFRIAQSELLARQRDLEDLGFTVIRVGWKELLAPERLRLKLLKRILVQQTEPLLPGQTAQRFWSWFQEY